MNLYDINEIRRLLADNGFHFTKSMGQNFLIAPWVPEKIVEMSGIDKSFGVLEIGPGIGTLTKLLCNAAGTVVSVELDKRLPPILAKTLAGCDNAQIISGDILNTDIPALVSEKLNGFTPCVCANLPYNITSPVISALIDSKCFGTMTLMVQREVALRICAKPGTADYGAFTLYVNYFTQPELLFDVPPDCFIPSPKVTSSVVKLIRRHTPECVPADEELFFRVVKAAFSMRRKTLVNALCAAFGALLSKKDLSEIVTSCGYDEKIRGETLGIPGFCRLSDAIGSAISERLD